MSRLRFAISAGSFGKTGALTTARAFAVVVVG
jgi:hypothetical protein